MHTTDVIIIGGGQAGLAMSRSLALRGVDHVVLERGRIAERWHSEHWRSLNLLTTNAMSVLPGLPYDGNDPDAFMSAGAFAAYLKLCALSMGSPVVSCVEVTEVEPTAGGYRVSTTAEEWRSQAVVIATGACETPFVRRWRRRSQPRFSRCPRRPTGSQGNSRPAACWWSAPRQPALSSLRRSMPQDAR